MSEERQEFGGPDHDNQCAAVDSAVSRYRGLFGSHRPLRRAA